jgi:hypothetical protein
MAAKRCPAATWWEIADTVEATADADAAAMLAGRQDGSTIVYA